MTIDAPNQWRLETPGHAGWERTARPTDPIKYFLVSCDSHTNEPADLWRERLEPKYRDRLPKIVVDENGVKWQVSEGWQKSRLHDMVFHGEDLERQKSGADPEQRLKDMARDGVDAEIIFPNKGLLMWATPEPEFGSSAEAPRFVGEGTGGAAIPATLTMAQLYEKQGHEAEAAEILPDSRGVAAAVLGGGGAEKVSVVRPTLFQPTSA